jgi:hypothetical protein
MVHNENNGKRGKAWWLIGEFWNWEEGVEDVCVCVCVCWGGGGGGELGVLRE